MNVIHDRLIPFVSGETYRFSYKASCVGPFFITMSYGEYSPVYIYLNTEIAEADIDFTTTTSPPLGSGFLIIFSVLVDDPIYGTTTSAIVDKVSLKKLTPAVNDNLPIKEFLYGDTDEGNPVFFRADTQTLQIQPNPEMYSTPIAIATETERGSQLKAFVSIDDKPFYQLEGTITKDVSILKTDARSDEEMTPPLAQSIQLSFRDSSKNRCRVVQTAIITTPTSIDYSQ